MKKVNESVMRDSNKKQFMNLKKEIDKSGGDIGDMVANGEHYPEDKSPNVMFLHNPFSDSKTVDTWEKFSKGEAFVKSKASIENEKRRGGKVKTFNEYTNTSSITENAYDPTFYRINKLKEYTDELLPGDKDRAFFNNLPDEDLRKGYDILRAGKFITFGKITGQIIRLVDDTLYLDIINSDNVHEIKGYDVKEVLKKLKNK
jgi:hypothetical protein